MQSSEPKQPQAAIVHAFPSANALDHAIARLMAMQERHLNLAPSTNVQRLLARHAPARPQVPDFKPAA